MVNSHYFSSETFAFLKGLAENNNRQWFQQNKKRSEEHVMDPAIRFIIDFKPLLIEITRQFT
ncbi:MAG: DUF2461 family protein, partial [Syntrophaceae bacterium]|nr:DUF2461 family protein [Syntrophaceae bacterium]